MENFKSFGEVCNGLVVNLAEKQMSTKFCTGCRRELPVSEFYRNRCMKNGLNYYCKTCHRDYSRGFGWGYSAQQEQRVEEVLGGYKIYILKYVKPGEFKFNVLNTNGKVFKTNKKEDFLAFISEI